MADDEELKAAEATAEDDAEAQMQAEADALIVKRQAKIGKFRAELSDLGIAITDDVMAQLLGQPALSKKDMLPAFGRERRRSKHEP